ncbi:hypothetical protein Pan44_08000 [Caulifigura coniformis]|uniref:Uncharacterized protein n=1 Tax=Caulifigura coniformis TaxID=2527983 RepID=A0A517S9J1_9PLAN|nr:hypothetical protein Pan44_08000 [Caulifigura coniformis]
MGLIELQITLLVLNLSGLIRWPLPLVLAPSWILLTLFLLLSHIARLP